MSTRLPIYRSINQRLEIMGLSLWEIVFLAVGFIVVSHLLSFTRLHTLIAGAFVLLMASLLRHLNRRFERNFILRLIRFCALPARLHRQLMMTSHVSREKNHD